MNEELRKTAGLRDCRTVGLNQSEKLKVKSGNVSKAILDNIYNNRLCKFFTFHSPLFNFQRKAAFTLAEVLITLGVIGVVAALTMPTLIQNYKKHEVVTKLKHASSVLQQAGKFAQADYGDEAMYPRNLPIGDADEAYNHFSKYYVPYLKFLKVEKTEKGVLGYLANGSVIYFRVYPGIDNSFVILCINKKACNSDLDNLGVNESVNGKDIFSFYDFGKVPFWSLQTHSRDTRIFQCENKTNHEACLSLIYEAGWKIPDDYPIKF